MACLNELFSKHSAMLSSKTSHATCLTQNCTRLFSSSFLQNLNSVSISRRYISGQLWANIWAFQCHSELGFNNFR